MKRKTKSAKKPKAAGKTPKAAPRSKRTSQKGAARPGSAVEAAPPFMKDVPGSGVSLDLDASLHGLEPILGAAYALTDRAYARLDGDKGGRLRVSLRSKRRLSAEGLDELGELFWCELKTQKIRWAIAKNNLPVRQALVEKAVLLAQGRLPEEPVPAPAAAAASEPPPEQKLTEEQLAEVSRLIAEVEDEIKDLKSGKGLEDPERIAATWEEKHGQPGGGSK
ncbi:MAG: hypothetical protein ABII00_02445 [Elusimicrobiota bacterium]